MELLAIYTNTMEAIAIRLEAMAIRLEAIAITGNYICIVQCKTLLDLLEACDCKWLEGFVRG